MSEVSYKTMTQNVSLLGAILGDVIAEAQSPALLEKIERIRLLSKSEKASHEQDASELIELLSNLTDDELVPVARAFSQFLNLTNIADQQHSHSREMDELYSATETLNRSFALLKEQDIDEQTIVAAVNDLSIELVLTAHPTEITRRSLIHKYEEIDDCLSRLELQGRTERETQRVNQRLRELITQVWYSHDFRAAKPSPIDEAKWGFAVVENSLWEAVPAFLRRLDTTLSLATGVRLPINAKPIQFTSWMGGDRDGNPNVTAKVTEEVMLLSRWMATDLYLKSIATLIDELSMTACTQALRDLAGGAHEPYRAVLRGVRKELKQTLANLEARLNQQVLPYEGELCEEAQLWDPVFACYESLLESGMQTIAKGAILDTLRCIRCFGLHLVKHDIRQESGRHAEVMTELTEYLNLGDYQQWNESERQDFLLRELQNPRPLIAQHWQPSASVQEVLDSVAVVAGQPRDALGSYVISMARQPSDVLAVRLLLKEMGMLEPMPVAPLFETLDDLNRAAEVMRTLLSQDVYRSRIDNYQMVMIGYSDSAKDAGVMAASWAQYKAQEELLEVCRAAGVSLTLFHGRGGSIGRGGAPAHEALMSQPPGSLAAGLRVTEQGEMIRTKLGLSSIAIKTFALYTNAILQANLLEPPKPKPEWREVMNRLSDESCQFYRALVRDNSDFVTYFRYATPEQELAKLPLGSRPARRKSGGGIESLRAIPWIFSWSQNRLMLPAWLGAAQALQERMNAGEDKLLQSMAAQWPFFESRLSMLQMVFAKCDAELSAYYDQQLVPAELQYIGEQLRRQLAEDVGSLQRLRGIDAHEPVADWASESVRLRNIYIHPLNLLQVELLKRNRARERPLLDEAIMVTIAGIAAGLRNTG